MTKRKVVCISGKFDDKSDFVLEPVCPDSCDCEFCKDAFWIEDIKDGFKTHYNTLIASIPILLLLLGGTIVMWKMAGWHVGMIIPLATLTSIFITYWVDYWEDKSNEK